MISSFYNSTAKLFRKKEFPQEDLLKTSLKRCLNVFDLTLYGVGHMVGAGIFVVTGTVTKNIAGPGVIISYLIAGVASLLSALCYAEFGARISKAGSAYTYTYICIGELFAFIVGWNLLLEYLLTISSVAKAWSGSVDAVFKMSISKALTNSIWSSDSLILSKYPDILALVCILFWTIFVAVGAKLSSILNNVMTMINVLLLFIIFGTGLYYADFANWKNENRGGFLPYGVSGVITGSATCFYAYVGFEGIATAGEETQNPARNIPIALGVSILITSLLYLGASTSLTLLIPYYSLDSISPFPEAFRSHGAEWATYVVGIGMIISLSCSLLGGIFVVPRSLYAIATDGLLFKAFAYVHSRTQTPLFSTIFTGLITSLAAFFINLDLLVELLSIGTLFCFTVVDINLIILRYLPVPMCPFPLKPDAFSLDDNKMPYSDAGTLNETENENKLETTSMKASLIDQSLQSYESIGKIKPYFKNLPLLHRIPPGKASIISICLMLVFIISSWLLIIFGYDVLAEARWWAILLMILLIFGFLLSFGFICMYEQNVSFLTFQVPMVPLLPVISMCINIGMMLKLNLYTWIRLLIWISIGLTIYFAYGYRHSVENEERLLSDKVITPSYNGTTDEKETSPKITSLTPETKGVEEELDTKK